MSVGEGIFAGSIAIAIVYLYTATRNTWAWKRIAKRLGLALVALLALAGIALGGLVAYSKWENRPQVMTSFKGITLGEAFSDTTFRLGPFKEIKYGDAPHEKLFWHEERNVTVTTRDGRVDTISYSCAQRYDNTSINQIGCQDSGERIKEEFQKLTRILCGPDKERNEGAEVRLYEVPKYGVQYILQLDKVTGFLIAAPNAFENIAYLKDWRICA
jgi:hypothetical protein